jgi:Protein of unknown function (DUF3800)
MLHAFVDDSGSEPSADAIILAGFVGTFDEWGKFNEQWERVCAKPPAIEDFHMADAWRMARGYWGNGTPDERRQRRDERLDELASLVEARPFRRIQCSMAWHNYIDCMKGKVPPQTDSPYFWCFIQIIMEMARWQTRHGLMEKVEFVFDHDSRAAKYARGWHSEMLEILPPEARYILSGTPHFSHDKDVVSLKSADMLAWYLNRAVSRRDQPRPEILTRFLAMPGISIVVDRPMIKAIMETIPPLSSRPDWVRQL